MKTVEPRSLLSDCKKEIVIPSEIESAFNNWLKRIRRVKCKNRNQKIEALEIFYAGYILSNPVVRDQYKEADKLEL